jgi:hypothetical protein
MKQQRNRYEVGYVATLSVFALEYAIKKVQENQVRPELNGTHQLLAYADDVNLLGDDNVRRYHKEKHKKYN